MNGQVMREPLKIKKSYMEVVRTALGSYLKNNHVENRCVKLLYNTFTDQGTHVGWLLKELLDPASEGVQAELVYVFIEEDKVVLQASELMDELGHIFAVQLDRDELIRLTQDWQRLRDKKAPVIFIFCKDEKYFVSDVLPEAIK